MKRRKFLTIAGIGASLVAIPAIGVNTSAFFRTAVGTIVRRNLDYLQIGEEATDKFTNDLERYIKTFPYANEQKLRVNIAREYLLGGSKKSETSEYLTSRFLLSSDFFVNKMDESRQVDYVGFYGSYERSCANPFSHFYYA